MRFTQRCKELQSAHEKAHRDILHAQDLLEREIGDRLRQQQRVILSVLAKANGREVPTGLDRNFHAGCGAWAVALRGGFEVTAIKEETVMVRALCLPGTAQTPATYGLPLAMLTRSDRATATRIRASVRRAKEAARSYRRFEAKQESRVAAREVRATERRLASLRSKHEKLLKEAQ